jgi:hypothetical protein
LTDTGTFLKMSTPSDHISDKAGIEPETDLPDVENGVQTKFASEEHGHLSIGDVFRGTAVSELTPFERKAALINA